MNKILITGSAGFIGFHLVNKLLAEGFAIVGLDNINDYYDVQLKFDRLQQTGIERNIENNNLVASSTNPNYRFIKIDLEEKDQLFKLFENEKFDYVINLAAQAGVRYSLTNPYSYLTSNIYGFLNILEACRQFPVKHLIYASSSSVYGANRKIPFQEGDITETPLSLYAATKKSNELFSYSYAHLFGIPSTGLRFFTVYGPWGRPDMAYFSFTKDILEERPIKVFNNGNMMRDFTFISDIVESISKLLQHVSAKKAINNNGKSEPAHNIFNIGASKPVQLVDMIKTIESAVGKKAVLEYYPMQPGDVESTFADVNKLENMTKNMNKISISKGIPEFVAWYKSYYHI